jgi:hypothetical protein
MNLTGEWVFHGVRCRLVGDSIVREKVEWRISTGLLYVFSEEVLKFLFCCLTCAEYVLSIGCCTDDMSFVVCEVSLCFCISAVCCILFGVCPSAGRGILYGVRKVDMVCVGFCMDCVL